jgi:hypothetical protein
MSEISCTREHREFAGPCVSAGKMDDAVEKPYVDDLSSVPLLRIKLDDPSFGQEGDLDRVDPGLRSEHALDGLNEGSRRGYMKEWL